MDALTADFIVGKYRQWVKDGRPVKREANEKGKKDDK